MIKRPDSSHSVNAERLRKGLGRKVDESEKMKLAELPQLPYINVNLLIDVIRHVKENFVTRRRSELSVLKRQISEEKNDEILDELAEKFIFKFMSRLVIDPEVFKYKLRNLRMDDRNEFLSNTVAYYYSLDTVRSSSRFSTDEIPRNKRKLYWADVIRYIKMYMNYVYGVSFDSTEDWKQEIQ